MPKQFASFNTFVSRQTLPISSCDGLFTDQRRHGGNVHLSDDIAVVCSKHSQTSHLSNTKRRKLREPKAIRKRTARSLYTAHIHRSNFRMTTCLFNTSVRANHQHLRFPHHAKTTALFFCCSNGISGTNTQQHLKSALHAVVLGS